jgi:hypothetical protein
MLKALQVEKVVKEQKKQEGSEMERIAHYKRSAPKRRVQSSVSFSGQWRASPEGRSLTIDQGARSMATHKPNGDGSAFSNSGTWSVADGHQPHQETTKQVAAQRRTSMRRSISLPAGVAFAGEAGASSSSGGGGGGGSAGSGGRGTPVRSRRDSTPFRSAQMMSPGPGLTLLEE